MLNKRETKTLIWTQPQPTSKLLCFRRQWLATPPVEFIADGKIIILMLVAAESKKVI